MIEGRRDQGGGGEGIEGNGDYKVKEDKVDNAFCFIAAPWVTSQISEIVIPVQVGIDYKSAALDKVTDQAASFRIVPSIHIYMNTTSSNCNVIC